MMFRFHHHHQLLLLYSTSRPSLIKPQLLSSPSLLSSSHLLNNKWYSQSKDDSDNDNHVIGVKARSTADEFARVAKEKIGSVSQSVEEDVREAAAGTVETDEPDVESVKNKQEKSEVKKAKVERKK